MDVFDLRNHVIDEYADYVRSFVSIRNDRIAKKVAQEVHSGFLWPDALIQLNPSFEPGLPQRELIERGDLHPECGEIFRRRGPEGQKLDHLRFHRHQVEAIQAAREGGNYVLTTGTGSGKSLAYIVPIVDHVLRRGTGKGIQAIVVYPMNALANSQVDELRKFLDHPLTGSKAPVTFRRYTGQESREERKAIQQDPPDILLTNYVMLELILTRLDDRPLVRAAQDLRFLVMDELHTYRGRQGADVSMLIRRVREACGGGDLIHVGTSATLGGTGSWPEQQVRVAEVATTMFGSTVRPENVIGESLRRSTQQFDWGEGGVKEGLRKRVRSGRHRATGRRSFVTL
jgi:ATP-dependent helicase YprA (DUF1998 family)